MANMDKDTATAISAEVKRVITELAVANGWDVRFKGGSYDPSGVLTPKFEIRLPGADKERFGIFASFFDGLSEDDFGVEIVANGIAMKVCGINTRATKSPLELKDAKGNIYRMSVDAYLRIKSAKGVSLYSIVKGKA